MRLRLDRLGSHRTITCRAALLFDGTFDADPMRVCYIGLRGEVRRRRLARWSASVGASRSITRSVRSVSLIKSFRDGRSSPVRERAAAAAARVTRVGRQCTSRGRCSTTTRCQTCARPTTSSERRAHAARQNRGDVTRRSVVHLAAGALAALAFFFSLFFRFFGTVSSSLLLLSSSSSSSPPPTLLSHRRRRRRRRRRVTRRAGKDAPPEHGVALAGQVV